VTGFSKHTRELVYLRAQGRCERCGVVQTVMQYHHRRPRAMGGSKAADTNTAANCLLLCNLCHQAVEDHRIMAKNFGFLVPQGKKPSEVPLWRFKKWVILDDFGYVIPAEKSA